MQIANSFKHTPRKLHSILFQNITLWPFLAWLLPASQQQIKDILQGPFALLRTPGSHSELLYPFDAYVGSLATSN